MHWELRNRNYSCFWLDKKIQELVDEKINFDKEVSLIRRGLYIELKTEHNFKRKIDMKIL